MVAVNVLDFDNRTLDITAIEDIENNPVKCLNLGLNKTLYQCILPMSSVVAVPYYYA